MRGMEVRIFPPERERNEQSVAEIPLTDLAVIVLAAGLGKRFKSSVPKVLHRANGRPLIHYAMAAVNGLEARKTIVVVGQAKNRVIDEVTKDSPKAVFVEQPEQLGTADAVRRCYEATEGCNPILVVNGDCPLLRTRTLAEIVNHHRKTEASATLLTARLHDPRGLGRIVRGAKGNLTRIIEEADASPAEQAIDEVSTGVWCFERAPLFDALPEVTPENAQSEYYLPDAAWVIASKGGIIDTVASADPKEGLGVNDRAQLAEAASELRARKNEKLVAAGVTIEDPSATYIDDGVEVGPDTLIRPNTYVEGETRIGKGCTIGPATRIVDSVVEDGTEVTFAVLVQSQVGPNCSVGPFAYLRPGTRLDAGAKAGTFVEINRTTIGEGSKVPHLSYLGDAEVGKNANIGAGTITGNFDGETGIKSKTVIEDDVLTGSGTTIVAPAKLAKGAVTGAGSVVTKPVDNEDVVIGIPAKPFRKRRRKDDSANKGGKRGDQH